MTTNYVTICISGFQPEFPIEIPLNGESWFIIPLNFIESEESIKTQINSIEKSPSQDPNFGHLSHGESLAQTGIDRGFFLILEISDVDQFSRKELLVYIEKKIRFFLIMHSILFSAILKIDYVVVFKKYEIFSSIRRFLIYNSPPSLYTQTTSLFDVNYNQIVSQLFALKPANDFQNDLMECLFELRNAVLISDLQLKIMSLWNYLEHIYIYLPKKTSKIS